MVKSPERRRKKYEAKVDGDVQAKQIRALKPSMVRESSQYFARISDVEKKVKALVEAEGVSSLKVRDYLNYAREIFHVTKTFAAATRDAEAQLKVNKWTDRGLNSNLLVSIAHMMGADPTPTPTGVQEVDVTDREDRELGKVTVKNFEDILDVDVTDRADREMGLTEIKNMPSAFPLPASQVADLKAISNFPSSYPLPASQVTDLKNIRALTTADRIETCPDSDTVEVADATTNSVRVPIDSSIRHVHMIVYPKMFNGSTWDRIRGTIALGLLTDISDDNARLLGQVCQPTRTNLKAQTEREDLISLGGVASPNNAGVLVVSGTEGQKIKVYDALLHGAVDGLHYFYFGTSTSPTSKRFLSINTEGLNSKTFKNPRVGDAGDSLYLFSSVSESNMPYDIGYVKE